MTQARVSGDANLHCDLEAGLTLLDAVLGLEGNGREALEALLSLVFRLGMNTERH